MANIPPPTSIVVEPVVVRSSRASVEPSLPDEENTASATLYTAMWFSVSLGLTDEKVTAMVAVVPVG